MQYKALWRSIGYVGRAIHLRDALEPLERLQRACARAYVCVQKPPIENVEELWREQPTLASLAETCKNTVNARDERKP